jgi:hypothetical protein
MRQSEPALVPAEVPIIADVPEEVIATVVAKVAPVKPRPVVPVLAPAPIAKLARVRR